MSYVLDGSTDALYCAAPVVAYPFSISAWVKTTDFDQNGVVASIDRGSSGDQNWLNFFGSAAGDYIRAAAYDGTYGVATTTAGLTSGWHHLLGVFASATDRRVYLDGGGKGTDVTDHDATSELTYLTVGGRYAAGSDLNFGGYIAELGIWDLALSDANAAALAGGAYPTDVELGNLLDYFSFGEDAISDGGSVGSTLIDDGTATFNAGEHPTMGGAVYRDVAGIVAATTSLGGTTSVISYKDVSGTVAAITTLECAASLSIYRDVAGTVAAQASITGSAIRVGTVKGSYDTAKTKRRLVAVANDTVYYEEI